jgi:hypothetical protein
MPKDIRLCTNKELYDHLCQVLELPVTTVALTLELDIMNKECPRLTLVTRAEAKNGVDTRTFATIPLPPPSPHAAKCKHCGFGKFQHFRDIPSGDLFCSTGEGSKIYEAEEEQQPTAEQLHPY